MVYDIEKLKGRKPARRMAEIPREVREALDAGVIESKNLVEWLSIDRFELLKHWSQASGVTWDPRQLREIRNASVKVSGLKQSRTLGRWLSQTVELGDSRYQAMAAHPSDVVREWTAFIIAGKADLPFLRKLAWIKPLADDVNAGVREVAWIALRDGLIAQLDTALEKLVPWTGSRNERLRRFASELTRPCGVWAAHVPRLKAEPHLGLPILEPLRADPSRYVQDSVANWLNDASKSAPDWVGELAARWLRESPCAETARIVRRGLRTLQN
jgi:3-methyladenine DNA glycosylase AlkC